MLVNDVPSFRALSSSFLRVVVDEGGPMRKRARWLILLGSLACLAVAGSIAWEATRPPPPIREFYAGIQLGMTREQVQAVFGSWWDCPRRSTLPVYDFVEGEITPGAGQIITWDWYDQAVLVSFDVDGRVREKALAKVPWQREEWGTRFRRLIGLL
jgi:hypothetical protein